MSYLQKYDSVSTRQQTGSCSVHCPGDGQRRSNLRDSEEGLTPRFTAGKLQVRFSSVCKLKMPIQQCCKMQS